MELFILVKAYTTLPCNNDRHPQLQSVERAKGTQHTGRRGFQPGREETKDKTPPTCQKHPAGYTPIKVSTGKTQCLWIPVPSLKEQLSGAQVTETESVLGPIPSAAPIAHILSAWLYLPYPTTSFSILQQSSLKPTVTGQSWR